MLGFGVMLSKRTLLFVACLSATFSSAQTGIGWIAPEGRIINNRTLNWNDFQEKEDKEHADALAARNLQAQAYVSPAIYFMADSGYEKENGRVMFNFKVKCAFQTRAFARESTKKEKSNYILIHEQDHYDIALNYSNKLYHDLTSRDYSAEKYNEEIHKLYNDLYDKYHAVQQRYDNEVNPEGRDDREKQFLWDMRIRKCLDNNTDEFYDSPASIVESVKAKGAMVKRIPGEPALQFVVRCRPLYNEFPAEMMTKVVETREWTPEPAVVAFYTQKFYVQEDGGEAKDAYRTYGYIFLPNGKDSYRRVFIDTFAYDTKPVKIGSAFFANADSDDVKELIITASCAVKDASGAGTLYMNRAYDNVGRLLPGKLKRLDDVTARINGGFEGIRNGKPEKAAMKNEKEIGDALKKLGYK